MLYFLATVLIIFCVFLVRQHKKNSAVDIPLTTTAEPEVIVPETEIASFEAVQVVEEVVLEKPKKERKSRKPRVNKVPKTRGRKKKTT